MEPRHEQILDALRGLALGRGTGEEIELELRAAAVETTPLSTGAPVTFQPIFESLASENAAPLT